MTKNLFRIWVKRDFCRNRLGRLKICCHKEALNSRNISLSTCETHSLSYLGAISNCMEMIRSHLTQILTKYQLNSTNTDISSIGTCFANGHDNRSDREIAFGNS